MEKPSNADSTESRWLARVCVAAFLLWLPLELLRGVIPSDSIHTFLADQAFANVAQALGALGAVLAIVGAAYVTRAQIAASARQTQAQIEAAAAQVEAAEKRSKAAATQAAVNNARNVVAAVSAEVELIYQAMPAGDLARLTLHKFRLLEAAALAQTVQLEHLPIQHQAAVIATKSLAAGLLGSLAMVMEARDPIALSSALQYLAGIAEDQVQKMAKHERDVSTPV